uniref:Large ribosomal subunit protein uL10 n=1 Tax=Pseudonaja textilis TaxID=8673 RepID=A0A670YJB6_PSETE
CKSVHNIASACLQTGYPTVASLHHSFINGYKRVLAVAVETNSFFPLDEKVKAFLVDLSAFAAAAPAVTEAAAPAAAVPAKEEVKEKSKEFDEDMGFGLFD